MDVCRVAVLSMPHHLQRPFGGEERCQSTAAFLAHPLRKGPRFKPAIAQLPTSQSRTWGQGCGGALCYFCSPYRHVHPPGNNLQMLKLSCCPTCHQSRCECMLCLAQDRTL